MSSKAAHSSLHLHHPRQSSHCDLVKLDQNLHDSETPIPYCINTVLYDNQNYDITSCLL